MIDGPLVVVALALGPDPGTMIQPCPLRRAKPVVRSILPEGRV